MRKPTRTNIKGKGGKSESLPSRFAKDSITGADPTARLMGRYGKQSPMSADGAGMSDMPMPPMLSRPR